MSSLLPIDEYFKPVRPVVTMRDKLGDNIYLFHDSFFAPETGSSSPLLNNVEVNMSLGGAGTFTITIDDYDRQIDETKIKMGNEVFIDVGRNSNALTRLFAGVVRGRRKIRDYPGGLRYIFTGFGSQIIFNERIVNFLRSALPRAGDPTRPFYDDPNMKLWKLVTELCNKTDPIPLGWPPLVHTNRDNFLNAVTDQMSQDVNQFIPVVFEPYLEAGQAINNMSDVSGAIWGVDAQNRIFLRYPSSQHSGIIIKNRPDDPNEFTEPNSNVSYLMADTGWSYEDSMRKEDGFFNRIFSKTGTISRSQGSSGELGGTIMANIDIAQQFTVSATRLRDLTFRMTHHATEFWGGNLGPIITIVNDDHGRPGSVVELRNQPSWFLADNQAVDLFVPFSPNHVLKTLKPGDKAWIIMYARGVVIIYRSTSTGAFLSAEPDPSRTNEWHHDNGTIGVSAVRTFNVVENSSGNSVQSTVRDPDRFDTTTGWIVNNRGPTYSHIFTDEFSHIVEASDQESIDEYGLIETFHDANWITDAHTMNAYLASILQDGAKPRRIFEMQHVTIPYNAYFMPGQLVTIQDDVANVNMVTEIQEVTYRFSSQETGQDPRGRTYCEIRPLAYVDFRDQYIINAGTMGPLNFLPLEGEIDGGLATGFGAGGGQVDVPLKSVLEEAGVEDISELSGLREGEGIT